MPTLDDDDMLPVCNRQLRREAQDAIDRKSFRNTLPHDHQSALKARKARRKSKSRRRQTITKYQTRAHRA